MAKKTEKDYPVLKEWLTCSQVAGKLKISRQSANRMVQDGEFASVHLLGERPIYVVKTTEVDKILKKRLAAAAKKQEAKA